MALIALIPTWLQEFEREAGYMSEPKMICLICKKLKRHQVIYTGKEALEHTKLTGHNDWELYQEKRLTDEKPTRHTD